MGKTVTKLELSEIVGRDERTLSRWQKDGMPVIEFGVGRGNENQYDTQLVIDWLMRQAALNGKKESTRDRLDRIRGDREELALAKDLGEVVIEADLVQRFEAVITAAKIELLNTLPDELAETLSARYGVQIDDQLIRQPIESILRRLSAYDEDDDLAGDSDEPDDAEGSEEDGE
ncbi:UNVERIFIED_ORG: phage terminase Nu1 subunit (DNA packaging protein) [Pseudomonas parafulva]|uniref:Terminase small subunit n=1 Tax=Pseudomonas juntendi TaxID=2666183 RepID=A0AAJ5RV59_9PSED|nr:MULTISPECIES: terminase small subunit [Pseudomonas]MDP9557146.1 phage terminase Nu1 subunit (DNA packaging protein) [Pseudomonas parafulva]MDP9664960.1 phage terminase Nu1 subunit (DNA packaging protein) [Pseudomonas cremoricolorata]MBH3365092.1 terminase small subunit [Pseudomonas sp. URMO17WK12:I11]QDC05207.1 terminase small subunit [Pseudomonas sp. SWI7]WEA19029.1 terminase small subunit [Pseudomonas juntendi]